jgi:hypothetical protein
MKTKSKALQASKRLGRPKNQQPLPPRNDGGFDRSVLERTIRAEINAEPAAKIDRFERYKRLLARGDAPSVHLVINAAFRDALADQAVRQHCAELIDQGREDEMSIQLRAYAVKYLVDPVEIMRQRDA